MKILKYIGIALVAIIALVLITAAVVKKEYTIERSIVINKPKSEVFPFVNSLKNQNGYSYWAAQDPNMKIEYRGGNGDGTVGFTSAWNSETMGVGEQEIKSVTEGEKIDLELRFKEPMEATAQTFMATTDESDNTTKVTWGMSSAMPYPFNIMLLFGMEKSLNDQIDYGLANMKKQVEAMPSPTVVAENTTAVVSDSSAQAQAQTQAQ